MKNVSIYERANGKVSTCCETSATERKLHCAVFTTATLQLQLLRATVARLPCEFNELRKSRGRSRVAVVTAAVSRIDIRISTAATI